MKLQLQNKDHTLSLTETQLLESQSQVEQYENSIKLHDETFENKIKEQVACIEKVQEDKIESERVLNEKVSKLKVKYDQTLDKLHESQTQAETFEEQLQANNEVNILIPTSSTYLKKVLFTFYNFTEKKT